MRSERQQGEDVGTRERKRARFEPDESASKKKQSAVMLAVVAAAIVIASVYFLTRGSGSGPTVDRHVSSPAPTPPQPTGDGTRPPAPAPASAASASPISPDGDVFRLPVGTITTEATFFKAQAGAKSVPFFAVRDAVGRIHVALDACQVCSRAKKGYLQQGDHMQCRNCGMTFAIAQITEMGGKGGCHPISLPSSTSGDAIVVKQSDVAAGAKWF